GQFCDADLEVAFRKSTCYIRDLKGNDLLTGSHGTELYSITLQDTNSPNPICLMAKTTSSQPWLWHHRLSYLNFETINLQSKNDIVVGLPKLKIVKDYLCSSCQRQANVPQADRTVTTSNELDLLFSLMFDELLNGSSKVVFKSSAVFAADAPYQRQNYTTPLNIHTTPAPTNLKLLINFVEKFLGTVNFGNDQIAPILGYGDLVQGAVTIKRVYYVEGMNHNLFSVGQFCDADLEVAFRKSTWCLEVFLAHPKTRLTSDLFALMVKNNREKDKIRTNPDQIKKKGEA
nr:retrovirus-related Pol polyprotein from transposon TNT 1-94 [Tanacetum cinerariifolium]